MSWREGHDPARVDRYENEDETFFVWRDVVKGIREAGTSNAYLLFVRRMAGAAKLAFDRTDPHPAWPREV